MIKDASTYEIMTPESVGLTASNLVMGKHSGRAAFRQKLEELGYKLGDNEFQDAFHRFKALADEKKHVYDEDIIALVDRKSVVQGRSVSVRVDIGGRRRIKTKIKTERQLN